MENVGVSKNKKRSKDSIGVLSRFILNYLKTEERMESLVNEVGTVARCLNQLPYHTDLLLYPKKS